MQTLDGVHLHAKTVALVRHKLRTDSYTGHDYKSVSKIVSFYGFLALLQVASPTPLLVSLVSDRGQFAKRDYLLLFFPLTSGLFLLVFRKSN